VDGREENHGERLPRLYGDLAGWFLLLTAPEDYKNEAEFYRCVITENSRIPVKTVLEMGSGGGNNASHLKAYFTLTLTDLSEEMLDISRRMNPQCEHIRGDMQELRLGRQFDAVFIHDAVSYLTTEEELYSAIETAFIHCKTGGCALFCPDFIREKFRPNTGHGGHDGGNRALRYLEWTYDPDETDTHYNVELTYVFKEGDRVWSETERHVLGLFSETDWKRLMEKAGFADVKAVSYTANIDKPDGTPVFVGVREG
jgi:ubiquinone/menaquinone biosynthesis C-methylase UbiE